MKLASTTLIGPGTVELLDAALASVEPFVDLAILIPTTAEYDAKELNHCAKRAGFHGGRVALAPWLWCNDFSAARNFALEAATAASADWALTLDTDERYAGDPKVLRELLGPSNLGAYYVPHASGTYTNARLVRLPCPLRFNGRTHEAFPAYELPTLTLAPSVLAFSDVPKTPEQLEHKFIRDLDLLLQETDAHPEQTRWWFYLGETRRNLGDPGAALMAYDKCAALRGWDEESAWACYRAAECCCQLKLWQPAIDRCAQGLARHAGVGELAWLAGWASYQLGRWQDAMCWAAMAESLSIWNGVGRGVKRIGFSHPPARFELPHELMAWAWERLGQEHLVNVARGKARHALACRLGEKTPVESSASGDESSSAATP